MNLFAPIRRRAVAAFAVAALVGAVASPAVASGGRITFVGAIVNPTCGTPAPASGEQSRALCTTGAGTSIGGHTATVPVDGTESKLAAYLTTWAQGAPQMVVVTYD